MKGLRKAYGLGLRIVRPPVNRLVNLFDRPVIVLLYHRVATLTRDPQMLSVTPEYFRSQLRWLKEHFPILCFEDDWFAAKCPAVVVTFDDGYADNFLEALPILEEENIPATFFICTGNIGTDREFWWDELERIVLSDHSYPPAFTLDDNKFGRTWSTSTQILRSRMYDELHPIIKKVDCDVRENFFDQLRQWADVDAAGRSTHRSMTVNELKKFSQSPLVTLGAHTVTHTPLSSISVDRQREEILRSKQQLEEWTGKEISFFSYPFGGKKDYTRETVRLCEEIGFAKTCSNFPSQVHRWTRPQELPRQLVRNWSQEEFAKKMQEFLVS